MSFFQLQSSIRWVFLLHALCGGLALAAFLIPLFSKKGGKLHVRTGWIYTVLMITVGVTAYIITPWRAFVDPDRSPSSQSFAVFLFFVATLTLAALWHGIVALRFKKRTAPSRAFFHIGPAAILITAGVGVEIIGFRVADPLLIVFPLVGVWVAKNQLQYWLSAPKEKMHWWYAHMEGMFTACIATLTAFLVTAVPRLVDATVFRSPLLWVAPGLILGLVLKQWTRSYRQKFGDIGYRTAT